MFTTTVRGMLAHKLRLVLTSASIALGIAFPSGTFMLTDTMKLAFAQLYGQVSSGTDAVVRQEYSYDAASGGSPGRSPIAASVLDTARSTGWQPPRAVSPGTPFSPTPTPGVALVKVAGGADVQVVQGRITAALADHPDAKVLDRQGYEKDLNGVVDQLFTFVQVMLLRSAMPATVATRGRPTGALRRRRPAI